MRWAVVYRDGSTFTSADGAPEDAPGAGVVAIGQEDADAGMVVHHGSDFYFFDESFDGWYGQDEWGAAQYFSEPGLKVVKLGRVVPMAEYRRIVRELQAGGHLPEKSARYKWEPR